MLAYLMRRGKEEKCILTFFEETQVGICFLIYIESLRFYVTRKMLLISYSFAHKKEYALRLRRKVSIGGCLWHMLMHFGLFFLIKSKGEKRDPMGTAGSSLTHIL